jgi:hypothetical protein
MISKLAPYNKATAGGGIAFVSVALLIQGLAATFGYQIPWEQSLGIALVISALVGGLVYIIPNVSTPGQLLAMAAKRAGVELDPAQADKLLNDLLVQVDGSHNKS